MPINLNEILNIIETNKLILTERGWVYTKYKWTKKKQMQILKNKTYSIFKLM